MPAGEDMSRPDREQPDLARRALLLAAPIVAFSVGCSSTPPPYLPPLSPEVMRFGVSAGIVPPPELTDQDLQAIDNDLDAIGPLWLRQPGTGTSWPEIQPDRDTWDFERLDSVLDVLDRPWIITVYGFFGYVYPFGGFSMEEMNSQPDDVARTQYIAEHTLDLSDDQQRADAEAYVKALVSRYQHQVRFWEIGNEGVRAVDVSGIVEATSGWIREVDPHAKVLVPALAGNDDEDFTEGLEVLDGLLADGLGEHFDIGNYHYYGILGEDFEERVMSALTRYADLLADHGLDKPIWVTETSTSSLSHSKLSGGSSPHRQACDVVRRFVMLTAHGAQRVFWHNFKFGSSRPGDVFAGCNLYSDDGKPKAAWWALQLVVDKIGHFQEVEILAEDMLFLYRYEITPGENVFVVWGKAPAYMTYDLEGIEGLEGQLVFTPVSDQEQENYDLTKMKLGDCPWFIEATMDDAWLDD